MPTLHKKTHKPKRTETKTHNAKHKSSEAWRYGKSSTARGYGYKWQKYREKFLFRNPLCVHCEAEGKVRLAKVVDHIIDHKGDKILFWDETNHQGLCIPHHNKKTAETRTTP